jgi:hypothetical protein
MEFLVKRYYSMFISHKELTDEQKAEETEPLSPKLPFSKYKKLLNDLFGKLIILDQNTLQCKYKVSDAMMGY